MVAIAPYQHSARIHGFGLVPAIAAVILVATVPALAQEEAPSTRVESAAPWTVDLPTKTKQTNPVNPNNVSQMQSLRACEAAMVKTLGGTSFKAIVETMTEQFVSNTMVQLQGTGNWSGRQRMFQRYQFTCRANVHTNAATITAYKKVGNRMW